MVIKYGGYRKMSFPLVNKNSVDMDAINIEKYINTSSRSSKLTTNAEKTTNSHMSRFLPIKTNKINGIKLTDLGANILSINR